MYSTFSRAKIVSAILLKRRQISVSNCKAKFFRSEFAIEDLNTVYDSEEMSSFLGTNFADSELDKPANGVLWLWKTHNDVNVRLKVIQSVLPYHHLNTQDV